GFNPSSYNAGEGAIGIFQWEGGRRTALDAYAASTGGSETSLTTQEGYLQKELSGPYKAVLARLKTITDPATAAAIWDVGPGGKNSGTGFENSSGDATGTRMADAQTIYQQISNGTLPGLNGQIAGGATTGAGSASDVSAVSGALGIGNPLNIGSDMITAVTKLVIKMGFTAGGIALVVLGLNHAAAPARQSIEQKAAPLAAAVA